MTNYYLDTEFLDDGERIKLISIGLVCEDGRELYLINAAWLGDDGTPDTTGADDWLRANVFPQLPPCRCPEDATWRRGALDFKHEPDCKWRRAPEIARAIAEFILVEPKDQIQIWAYFASYDWVAFCQLFGKMIDLPKHFPWLVNDLKTWSRYMGFTGKFRELLPDAGHHDALEDARWNRQAHYLLRQRFGLLETLDENTRATTLTKKLLDDLSDRAGFNLDGEVREMIRRDWVVMITESIAK